MPTFVYKAVDKNGQIVKNKVEEEDKLSLIKKLKENGFVPIAINQSLIKNLKTTKKRRNITDIRDVMKNVNTTQISEKGIENLNAYDKAKLYFAEQQKITSRDLVVFTQNFYLLKKANFNNVHALTTIINSTENLALAEILQDILVGVESGEYMYKTMEYYSGVFPYIYINMIRVGELSGSLENALLQAIEYLENRAALNRKLKGILIPNIIQFVLLIILLFVGTLYAIPQIQSVFIEVGTSSTLPAITLWFQSAVNTFLEYWYIPATVVIIAVLATLWYINTPKGKYKYHHFKYTMPIFGKLIFLLDFSRLIRATLLNLKNGMRLQEALEVSKKVVNNEVMLSIIENSLNNLLIGESWIDPLEKSGLASPMIVEMLRVGMQTNLIEMMEKLVEYMEIDINNTIERITLVLPQILYAIVGIVLIFFVIVILVPLVEVYFGNFLFDAYL